MCIDLTGCCWTIDKYLSNYLFSSIFTLSVQPHHDNAIHTLHLMQSDNTDSLRKLNHISCILDMTGIVLFHNDFSPNGEQSKQHISAL